MDAEEPALALDSVKRLMLKEERFKLISLLRTSARCDELPPEPIPSTSAVGYFFTQPALQAAANSLASTVTSLSVSTMVKSMM